MNATSKSNKIESYDIHYFRQRQKNKVFQSVIAYYAGLAEKEGLTKKELATKLGKDPAQITRWFSGAGNWTLDTISDILLAMNAEMKHEIVSLEEGYKKAQVFSLINNDVMTPRSSLSSTAPSVMFSDPSLSRLKNA